MIYRLQEVKKVTGLGRTSIYRKMADGTFPQGVKLGARATGWRVSEVEAWVAGLPGYAETARKGRSNA